MDRPIWQRAPLHLITLATRAPHRGYGQIARGRLLNGSAQTQPSCEIHGLHSAGLPVDAGDETVQRVSLSVLGLGS